MVVKYWLGSILLMLSISVGAQVVQEDFNHGSQSVSESNCWEYDNVDISSARAMNGGAAAPQARADINGLLTEADFTSPFVYFNSTGTLTFKHKLGQANGLFSRLEVVLVDPRGTEVATIFNHTYRTWGFNVNGNPTAIQPEVVNINWTGYYRVRWKWGGALTFTEAHMDGALMQGDFAADPSEEYNGYCPAIMEAQDTVCSGEQDNALTALYPRGSRSYTWSFTSTPGGIIDNSVSANDQTIEVDWNYTNGSYDMLSQESAGGNYAGNKTYFEVYVLESPEVEIVQNDTVCEGSIVSIDFTLSGDAPFTLEFNDDLGSHSVSSPTVNYTYTPASPINTLTLTGVRDANGCMIDISTLPNLGVYYFANPATGPIVHY